MNTTLQVLDSTPLQRRTQHFLQRQRERRINCQQVLTALHFGHRHEYGGFVYFYSRGLFIVADQRGNLVTAYWI